MSKVTKVKSWIKPIFEQEETEIQKCNLTTNDVDLFKKPTEVNSSARKRIKTTKKHNINIIRNFEPSSVEDLAVNNKKVQEVDQWINSVCNMGRGEILLLTGPVGCGKTATIQVLAKKYNMRISEWITPVDIDIPTDNGEYEYRENQCTKFQNFIINAANFSSLLNTPDCGKLVLVEDFPNTFLRTPSEFSHVLEQYRNRAKSPIVFICSESHTDGKNTPISLFTNNVKEQFNIPHIIFNGVSQTGLKSALNRVSKIICENLNSTYNKPSAEQIECVVNSSAGDVRSAVLNLHFACLKGANQSLETSILVEKDKKVKGVAKKKVSSSKFTSLGKDQSVSILHGVGRVLNPKLVTIEGKTRLTHRPEDVIEQFLTQPASFVSFLSENYLAHFTDVAHAGCAAAALSDADCLLAEWRDKIFQDYGLYIAVAGLMLANKAPLSAWNPVRGPKNMKVQCPSASEIPLLDENSLYKGKVLVSDYQTYCKIIQDKKPH